MITEVIDFEDGDGPWNHLRFADDILVFATSSQNVTYLLIQLAVALAKSRLLSSVGRGNSFQCKRVDPLSAQKLKYFDRIASFLVVRVLQQVTELYTAMTCTIWMLHIRDFSGQGPGLLASWLGRQVKSSQVKSSQVKSSQVKSSQVKSSQVKAWTPCGGRISGAGGEPKETIFTNPYLQIASL